MSGNIPWSYSYAQHFVNICESCLHRPISLVQYGPHHMSVVQYEPLNCGAYYRWHELRCMLLLNMTQGIARISNMLYAQQLNGPKGYQY